MPIIPEKVKPVLTKKNAAYAVGAGAIVDILASLFYGMPHPAVL